MGKTPNIADIIVKYFNQDQTLQEAAADLGAIFLKLTGRRNTTGNIPNAWPY